MASRKEALARRANRVRRQLKSVANGRPRLSVHRSSKNIYAQVIDDVAGKTLASASTLEKYLRGSLKTGADTAADHSIVPFGPDAFVVPFDLFSPIRRLRTHRFVKSTHIGFHPLIRRQRFVRRPVPSPIEADNDTFHETSTNTDVTK